jgi:hypothetical protein
MKRLHLKSFIQPSLGCISTLKQLFGINSRRSIRKLLNTASKLVHPLITSNSLLHLDRTGNFLVQPLHETLSLAKPFIEFLATIE